MSSFVLGERTRNTPTEQLSHWTRAPIDRAGRTISRCRMNARHQVPELQQPAVTQTIRRSPHFPLRSLLAFRRPLGYPEVHLGLPLVLLQPREGYSEEGHSTSLIN